MLHRGASDQYAEFLVNNIFVEFGCRLFQQIVGIAMGTYCAILLVDLILFSFESGLLHGIRQK